MQIAVITYPREPMYLWDTLRSIDNSATADERQVGPYVFQPKIDVFVGMPADIFDRPVYEDAWLLPAQSLPPSVHTHFMDLDLWSQIETQPPKMRAVANFMQALESGEGGIVLFEDDVVLKPGWYSAIQRLIKDFSQGWAGSHGIRPFVSLYTHQDPAPRSNGMICDGDDRALGFILKRPIVDFYGTCGLFVPGEHREALARECRKQLDPNDPRQWPFDEIVKMYVNDNRWAELIVSIPSWVDHVGDVSLINPTHGPRRSPIF